MSFPSVEVAIQDEYKKVISKTDTHKVSEDLRQIVEDAGLGVAILVAWQQGLKSKHIPLTLGRTHPRVRMLAPSDDCPYVFVHVPVRRIRKDKDALARRKIMNPRADPAWFIYHEDGLVGRFSFQKPNSVDLTDEDVGDILDALARAGILVRANVDNRQIQFKDLEAKGRIKTSDAEVYVRTDDRPLDWDKVKAKLASDHRRDEVWKYIKDALDNKTACNYCSVQALNPREVTIHTAHVNAHARRREDDLAMVRNYQLGFTFASFGDPQAVCHFLAWDFPHINDLVMNMEPQAYSFSDLIGLVRVINRDINKFCASSRVETVPEPVSGVCNHWAGNSIYHQHYQFFRIPGLPLVRACEANRGLRQLATYNGIEVSRVDPNAWRAPAFLIRSSKQRDDRDVMRVADRVARHWRVLNEGEDQPYGNGIAIKNHTQNTFVTTRGDGLDAIFIPRDRRKTSTPHGPIQKSNAGVLEMMGYFIIDNPEEFDTLEKMRLADPRELNELGDSWLQKLAPDKEPDKDTIRQFEEDIRICLSEAVTDHEEQVERLLGDTLKGLGKDPRKEAGAIASGVQENPALNHEQRAHLYRDLLSAVLDSSSRGSSQKPST